jgi:hypothetical protein
VTGETVPAVSVRRSDWAKTGTTALTIAVRRLVTLSLDLAARASSIPVLLYPEPFPETSATRRSLTLVPVGPVTSSASPAFSAG